MLTPVPTPRINTNDNKVEVVAWHAAENDYLESGQDVADLETSKAVVTITAQAAGYFRPLAKAGTVIRVGDPLYLVADTVEEFQASMAPTSTQSAPSNAPANTDAESSPLSPVRGNFGTTRFSKAALSFIQEKGLAPDDFPGAGLVTKRSLAGAVGTPKGRPRDRTNGMPLPPSPSVPAVPAPITPRVVLVSLAKQAEIESLSTGEQGNINSMLSIHFDSQPIRARLLTDNAFDGNIQPLILFEISRLLKKWPQFTAFFESDEIHYFDRIDLGVAFDLGKGLKVVTIPEADRLMPIDFYERTIEIGMRYLENRLRPEELVDSTVTITDLSGLNIMHFYPLINGRQAAIIGIGGDGSKAGYPMSLNMTFDHRVSNGREVAMFLNELRDRILSYAAAAKSVVDIYSSSSSESTPTPAFTENISCDICGIDLATYHNQFGRGAFMLAFFRDDGSLGSVCHRCHGGW